MRLLVLISLTLVMACDLGSFQKLFNWGFFDELTSGNMDIIQPSGAVVEDLSFSSYEDTTLQEIVWNELNEDKFQTGALMPPISVRRLSNDQDIEYTLLLRQWGTKKFIRLHRTFPVADLSLVYFLNVAMPSSPFVTAGRAKLLIVASKRGSSGSKTVAAYGEKEVKLYD